VILVLVGANFYFLPKAFAGTLTNTAVVEMGGASNVSPMIQNLGQSLAIEFTPASTGTPNAGGSGQIQITFNSWSGGSAAVNATQTVATNGCTTLFPSTPTAVPGSLTASGSGSVITIASVTSLTASTTYCTELTSTSAVTNGNAGAYTVTVSTGLDSQTVALDVLSAGQNAYSITATVAPTFTMSLSSTTDSFSGNLTSASVTLSTGITTTVNTNAKTGWFVWIKDSNAGLTSTQASKTIPTVPANTNETMNSGSYGPGHEYYGLGAVTGTNSPTILAAYAYGGGTTGGGLSSSTFYEVASHNVAANGDTFVTHELANITSTTPPATDYTDTLTEIGAGSF
jgi:hypothetical protein